jgi:ribulose 1,5-bisphosphate synthetase/thiazole synthase
MPVAAPARGSFDVHVLNGSGRSGLAATAARTLTRQGFHVTAVGNAPERYWHDHSAVIWCGPDGLGAAHLLATQLPASLLLEDQRLGTGVEVVLGTAYQLAPAASAPEPVAAP